MWSENRADLSRRVRHTSLRTPGRITRSARKYTLHLPARWPWRHQFLDSLARLRTVVLIT